MTPDRSHREAEDIEAKAGLSVHRIVDDNEILDYVVDDPDLQIVAQDHRREVERAVAVNDIAVIVETGRHVRKVQFLHHLFNRLTMDLTCRHHNSTQTDTVIRKHIHHLQLKDIQHTIIRCNLNRLLMHIQIKL